MQNKEIKIVIPLWGFSKTGGVRVLSRLASELSSSGFEVLVLCFDKSISPYFPVSCDVKYVDKNGCYVDRTEYIPTYNKLKNIIDIYNRYRGLKKALNAVSDKYNVVIANLAATAYAVNNCNIKNKYYYIQAYEAWEEHNLGFFKKINNAYIRRTYSFPLLKIVNADIYKNYKQIKSDYVVPPGLDLSIYYPKTEYWNGNRDIIVGCIGRTEAWKGSEDVAQAVDILQKKGLPVKFKIAFNPAKSSKFELVKPDGDSNLADYYRSLDIMIAPGTLQLGAIHYPVIESMACGTPVITTGYYPADENNSYIVPISAPEEIAKTIEHIMGNYPEAIEKSIVALNEIHRFDWKSVTDQMINIIKNTYQ